MGAWTGCSFGLAKTPRLPSCSMVYHDYNTLYFICRFRKEKSGGSKKYDFEGLDL